MSNEDIMMQKFGKVVPKGSILFNDGDSGTQMYVIHSGRVKISKKIGDTEKTLAILPPGEFFGEMAILNNEPRTATAEVVEDSELLIIDTDTFESMIKGNAEIAVRMIKKLSDRLREAVEQIENMMIKDANSKVINTLTRIAKKEGEATPQGVRVRLTLGALATKTGLPIERVTKIINNVVKGHLIAIIQDGIIIRDIEKLNKFLEFLLLKEQFGDI